MNRDLTDTVDQFQLDQLGCQQFERPTGLSLRWITARQHDELRLNLARNFGGSPWACFFFQGGLENTQGILSANVTRRRSITPNSLSDLTVSFPLP